MASMQSPNIFEKSKTIKNVTLENVSDRLDSQQKNKNTYESGIENYDEQVHLIATTTASSLRKHKFIIIPANKTFVVETATAGTTAAATTVDVLKQSQCLSKFPTSPLSSSLTPHSHDNSLQQQQKQRQQQYVTMPHLAVTTLCETQPHYNRYQRQMVTPTLSSSSSSSLSTLLSRADIIHQLNDMCELEAMREGSVKTIVTTPNAITATATAATITTATATTVIATTINTANYTNVKFSIGNYESDNVTTNANVNANAIVTVPKTIATATITITPSFDGDPSYCTTTIPAISTISTVNNITPFTSQITSTINTKRKPIPTTVRPVSALLPSNLTLNTTTRIIPTIVTSSGFDCRTAFNEHHSSMHSIMSAYITDSNQLTVNSFIRPSSTSTSCSGLIYDKKHNSSSYLLRDNVANKIYSDITSVRSLASIGLGSTDGQKLVIRRVPQTPNELLNVLTPTTSIPITSNTTAVPSKLPLKAQLSDAVNVNDFLHNKNFYNDDDDDDDDYYDDYINTTTYTNRTIVGNLKPRKQKWANKMQFVLACIGYSVGLGNVWRFPYMCYKSGGGVFLVPYCIILIVCSVPLLFMELTIGQYTGRGPIGAFGQLCPLFKGAGLASVVVSFLMSTYYSVIIAYSIYYFFTSFRTHLPWINCNNGWNTPDCWIPQRLINNLTAPDTSRTPSEEFFENKVLKISSGIEYPGTMRWELFVCLICAWLLVYFGTWKSIKSSAKVRYFTATFPFILIIILMIRAITLDGADQGLRYFFRPNWLELKNANVWINAVSQNFNSLGITFGSMVSFASYNKYNNNILHDTIAVSLVNFLTSLLVGVFAFATLGNLALEQNTNVKDVIGDGPGLIFVVYPQAMVKMPYAQLWAVMFFFMLLCLGLNSQFAIIEVVVTSIQDGFPNWIKRNLGYHEIVVLIVCIISCLFALPNILQSGIYFFQLMDHYAASITIMFLAFCQMVAIAWLYGVDRLSKNIKQMTGKVPSFYLQSCWVTLGPCLLFAIWILSLINYKEPNYHNGRYKYPTWANSLGWTIASLSLLCIPSYALINLLRASDGQGITWVKRLQITLRPNIHECKICGQHHCEHDFPEQEQYILQQELATLYEPQMTSQMQQATPAIASTTTTIATKHEKYSTNNLHEDIPMSSKTSCTYYPHPELDTNSNPCR